MAKRATTTVTNVDEAEHLPGLVTMLIGSGKLPTVNKTVNAMEETG